MIIYDSHKCCTFWRVKGSVFPRSLIYALPSTAFAFLAKYYKLFDTEDIDQVGSGTVYSGFTFVLGFILVFRTTQSYNRYWQAATSVHTMRAEWFDACGSLIAFIQITKMGKEAREQFTHIMIRLFCLLHAMALEEIASLSDENFPLLDIEGFSRHDLSVLTTEAAQGRKVEIVSQWIKVYMVKAHEEGLLPVPAPILTRVFQELGTGLVHYHEALQVVIWPFPFPYAQMTAVLITVYMFVTPIVICFWTSHAWYAAAATMMSITCMKGIDLIAVELENPFGDDDNDLPTFGMHLAMNRDLVLLLNPETWTIPHLRPGYLQTYEQLLQSLKGQQLSIDQFFEAEHHQPLYGLRKMKTTAFGGAHSSKDGRTRADVQNEWAKQEFVSRKSRTQRILHIPQDGDSDHGYDDEDEVLQHFSSAIDSAASSRHGSRHNTGVKADSYAISEPIKHDFLLPFKPDDGFDDNDHGKYQPTLATIPSASIAGPISFHSFGATPTNVGNADGSDALQSQFGSFLQQLQEKWQEHLEQQLQQQDVLNQRHLRALEQVLLHPKQNQGGSNIESRMRDVQRPPLDIMKQFSEDQKLGQSPPFFGLGHDKRADVLDPFTLSISRRPSCENASSSPEVIAPVGGAPELRLESMRYQTSLATDS